MAETIYVTGVVIANGIPDSEGDVLTRKDIKTIFAKYLDQNTDIMHDRINHKGIDVLANWISETDIELAGQTVPAGSWLATLVVTNEEVITAINEGNLTGLSLGSVSDDALTHETWFNSRPINYRRLINGLSINKSKNYSDLDDIEEVNPFWISFVDKPANQFKFEIVDYTTYINKRAREKVDIMTNEVNDPTIPISSLGKLRDFFKDDKSIDKAQMPVDEQNPAPQQTNGDRVDQLLTKIDQVIELENRNAETFQNILNILNAQVSTPQQPEEESINKASTEEPVPEQDEQTDEALDNAGQETPAPIPEPPIEEDDTAINKRASSKGDTIVTNAQTKSFYEKTNRDMFGRKLNR